MFILVAILTVLAVIFAIASKLFGVVAVVTFIAGIVLYLAPDLSVVTAGDMFGYMFWSIVGCVVSFLMAMLCPLMIAPFAR